MKYLFFTVFAVFFFLQPAFAANDGLDLNTAQILLQEGEPQAALDYLLADIDPNSTNTQEWFLMAMAAKSSGRPRQAGAYLKKVIELDPEQAGRAKLELAQLSYSLGNIKEAKNYLSEVKATKPPAKVGENIDQFIEYMEAQGTPKQWRLTSSIGWLYDSNANAGPSTDSVLLFGLPFILSDAAQENQDNALLLNFGFAHGKGLTDTLGWQSNIWLNLTNYTNLDSLDSMVMSGSTSLSLRISDKTIISSSLVADLVKIGHEDNYYSYSLGLAPQLRYLISQKLSANIGTTLSKKTYRNNRDRNSWNYSVSPSLTYQLSQTSFAQFGLIFGREDSGLKQYKNDLRGANAKYGYTLNKAISLSLNLSYTDTDYAGKEAAYSEKRHDKALRFGGDAKYLIRAIKADLILAISRTQNDSNLAMYEYDRNQVALSLQKAF